MLEENVLSVCECECIFYLSGSSTNKSASRVMTSSDLTGISLFVSYFCFITTISCFFEQENVYDIHLAVNGRSSVAHRIVGYCILHIVHTVCILLLQCIVATLSL